MSDKKLKQKKKEKEKSVFHKISAAGKGDVPRTSITQSEWGEKWEKIFNKTKENTDERR